MRTIQNINGKVTVNFHYKPKQDIVIKPKHTFTSDNDELINLLLDRFHFLVDISKRVNYPVKKPKKARGVRTKR